MNRVLGRTQYLYGALSRTAGALSISLKAPLVKAPQAARLGKQS